MQGLLQCTHRTAIFTHNAPQSDINLYGATVSMFLPLNTVLPASFPPSRPDNTDKSLAEQQGYSAVPPASPASMRRQLQLQHMRQQRQQHNQEREDRCLAGDAVPASGGRARGTKAQNAQQQARIKHNQGVKASANVGCSNALCCMHHHSQAVLLVEESVHHLCVGSSNLQHRVSCIPAAAGLFMCSSRVSAVL